MSLNKSIDRPTDSKCRRGNVLQPTTDAGWIGRRRQARVIRVGLNFDVWTEVSASPVFDVRPVDLLETGVQAKAPPTAVDGKRKDGQSGRIGSAVAHTDQHWREPCSQRIAKSRPLDEQPDDAAQAAASFSGGGRPFDDREFATSGNTRPSRLTGKRNRPSVPVSLLLGRRGQSGQRDPRQAVSAFDASTFLADACDRAGKGGSVNSQTSVAIGNPLVSAWRGGLRMKARALHF